MGKLLKAVVLSGVLLAVALYILISSFAPGETPREQVQNTKQFTKKELAKAREMIEEALPKPAPPEEASPPREVEVMVSQPGAEVPVEPASAPAPAEPETAAAPVEAPVPPTPKTVTHVVQEGDTLSSISQKYYGTCKKWKCIEEANPGVKAETLSIGKKLRIPDVPAETSAPPAVDPASDRAPEGTAFNTYKIRPGDTLYGIANRLLGDGNRFKEIEAANPGLDANSLSVGKEIRIPPTGGEGR